MYFWLQVCWTNMSPGTLSFSNLTSKLYLKQFWVLFCIPNNKMTFPNNKVHRSITAAWKPTACYFNHNAPHGGQFLSNARITITIIIWPQRSPAKLMITPAESALGLCTSQYITQLWLTGDTPCDRPGDTVLKWAAEVVSLSCICGQWAEDSW